MMSPVVPNRREDAARVIVRYGPELTEFLRRLSEDDGISSRKRMALGLLARGRSLAIDPLPDSTPLVGTLDERLTRSLVLRFALRGTNEEMIRHAWPGPEAPLNLLLGVVNPAGSAPRPRLPFLR